MKLIKGEAKGGCRLQETKLEVEFGIWGVWKLAVFAWSFFVVFSVTQVRGGGPS